MSFCVHMKKKWLDDCPMEFKSIIYKKYLNNCVVLYIDICQVDLFLNHLNVKYSNIESTADMKRRLVLPS